jgi:transposase-like protein
MAAPTGHKNPVLSHVQRGGGVRSFHVPNFSAASLRPIIARHIHSDSRFQTDELRTYSQVGDTFAYHGVVKRSSSARSTAELHRK